MTPLVALGPLASTPLLVWLLMEFGPERSVIFALSWIIPSVRAVGWALVITILAFIGLFFGFTPRVGAATLDRVEMSLSAPTRW